jgi:hypothetical protein
MEAVEELNREFARLHEGTEPIIAPAAPTKQIQQAPRIFSLHGEPGAIQISGSQHSVHGPFMDLWCSVTVVNYAPFPVKISFLRLTLEGQDWPMTRVFFRPQSDIRQRFDRISVRGNDKEDYQLHVMFPDDNYPKSLSGEFWLESDNLQEPFRVPVKFP